MKIKHNERKRKRIKYDKHSHEKILGMELQQLEVSPNYGIYHNLPRTGSKRSHKLSGNYIDCYGVGIDHKYRMVLKPMPIKDQLNSRDVDIIEYYENYHK